MAHPGYGSIRDIAAKIKQQSLFEIGYLTAASYLQQMRDSNREDTVETALKSAECELRLQRGKEEESIQRVRSVLERSGLCRADPVLEEGEKYDKSDQRQRVQALVLYNIAHQMYLERWQDVGPNALAEWIKRLVFDVRLASYNLADEKGMSSKYIALNYGVKLAKDMLNTVGNIDILLQVANHESAICKYHIADIYFRCEDYQTSLELLKQATDQFKESECESEHDHERYCIALWTLGNCHYRLKDFAKAEEQYDITIAEVKKLPATAAKWLKIVSEDLAKALLQQGKEPPVLETFHYGVSDDALTRQVNSREGDDSLESLLDIASNELLLQRGREEGSIQRLERKIFADGTFTAASLLKKLKFRDVGYVEKRVKALILYRIAHKLFREERHSAEDTIKWVQELVQDIQLSSYDLAAHKGALRTIAFNYGAKYAEFLRDSLFGMENATSPLLQMAPAQCLYHIANIYFRAEDFQTSLRYFMDAKRYFTEVFSESPRNIERYYITLWNIGNCNFRLQNFDDAERSYRDAISGLKKANPNIEQRWLKIVERDHKKAVARNRGGAARILKRIDSPPRSLVSFSDRSPSQVSRQGQDQSAAGSEVHVGCRTTYAGRINTIVSGSMETDSRKNADTDGSNLPSAKSQTTSKFVTPQPVCKKLLSLGQSVPRETVTKVIKGEDEIQIGGCTVSFPTGAFDGPQTVSLKAEIVSKKWPSGKRVITPSLLIDVKNLKKPLSIKLPTWCHKRCDDCDQEIDIMRSKDGESWEIIETTRYKVSGFIEFKCQHFSYVVAVIRSLALSWAGLKTAVYFGGRDIVVALSLNVGLYTYWLTKRMKEELGPDVKRRSFNSVVSDGSEVFHSSLSCENFVIKPSGPYEHSVKKILETGEASVQCCHLPIRENEPNVSEVVYKLDYNGKTMQRHSFGHSWSPSSSTAQDRFSFQVSRQGQDQSTVTINTAGGDVHVGSETRYNAPIQTNVPGSMETRNTNCQDSMTIQNPPPQ